MPLSIDKKCCVPNCGKTRLDGTILHCFPDPDKDPDRFRTWLYAIGGDIMALENKTIHKYRRVCHHHFEERFYTATKRLCANATPTLNLPGFFVGRRKPLQEIGNINVETIYQSDKTDDLNKPSTSSQAEDINLGKSTSSYDSLSSKKTVKVKSQQPCSKDSLSSKKTVKVKSQQPCSKGSVQFKQQSFTYLKQRISKLQKVKDDFKKKLKRALVLTENSSFIQATRNFTTAAMILFMLQIKQANKGKFGRKYTKEEKILSLAFYKMGPRAYRWFRNILVLPAPVTLSRMIASANLQPGINASIFASLKKRASKMSEIDRLCVLLFDEMQLTPHFDYSKKKDLIRGFVDNGTRAEKKIADHVLVFMLRGINKNYKQPLAYTFSSGSTPKIELKNQIKSIISAVQAAGFNVIATICDQGTSNVSAIKELVNETKSIYLRKGEEIKNNIFIINNEEIAPLFDVPHLLKGIRNNMLTKNIKCKIDNKLCTGKWDHIIRLYEENPAYKGLRFLPKLTENHVIPGKIKKMKVLCATQVFSSRVAMCLGYFADKKIIAEESKSTADIIKFFDDLFDSLNGSYGNSKKNPGKPLLGPVTPFSCHQEIWTEAKQVLKSMQFIDKQGNEGSVPSITNWIWTIENVEFIKKKLYKDYSLRSFWMRYFNQDPLENFFGSIRSHGVRNVNPTCANFEIAFAAVLVNNLCNHSKGFNCEEDAAQNVLLNSLKKIFFRKKKLTSNCNPNEIMYDDLVNDHILVDIEKKKENLRAFDILKYVAGYVIRQAKKNIFHNCETCKLNVCSSDFNEFEFTLRKERIKGKSLLTYPTKEAIEMFSNIQDVVSFILSNRSNIYNLKNYIKTILMVHCNFNFIKCEQHSTQLSNYIIDLSCNLFLYSWCKNTNRILCGLTKDIEKDDFIQNSAIKYYNKRKK